MEEVVRTLAKALEIAFPWIEYDADTRVLLDRLRRLPSYPDPQSEELLALVREMVVEAVAETVTRVWDRYGAPTVARTEEGEFLGSFEEPGGPYTVRGESKREAYRLARREWIRRILAGG